MFRFPALTAIVTLFTSPALALQLTPSQPVYEVTEPVVVVAYNDGSEPISFASSDPYVLTNLTTSEVFTFVSLPIVFDVPPGESETFTVLPGVLTPGDYDMEFEFYTPPWEVAFETTTFKIMATTATGAETFSAAKSRYVREED